MHYVQSLVMPTGPMVTNAGGPTPLRPGDPVSAPVPSPTLSDDHDVIRKQPVWSWDHDPARPDRITNLRSLVRGMGMKYAMPMPVCEEIAVEGVRVVRRGRAVDLPLETRFVMDKFHLPQGTIRPTGKGYWLIDHEVDQSLLVVFGFQLRDGELVPFTAADADALGPYFMPDGHLAPGDLETRPGTTRSVVVGPLRVVVAFSLTCCKEKNDFEPGGVLGANRVFPHVMFLSNAQLDEARATIRVRRPAKSHKHPGMTPAVDAESMLDDISAVYFTDTNTPIGSHPVGLPALPLWDNFFDYYDVDPWLNPDIGGRELWFARTSLTRTRHGTVEKDPHGTTAIFKLPQQGAFDNVHLAPKMKAPPDIPQRASGRPPRPDLDRITMAPFCVHDCLHLHVRWANPNAGSGLMPRWALGFDGLTPYASQASPNVPFNQSVGIRLLAPNELAYTVVVDDVPRGEWQVVMHHGLAYANDVWEPGEFGPVQLARTGVEAYAQAKQEESFGDKYWPWDGIPWMANTSWAIFYWRLRYMRRLSNGTIEERIALDRAKIKELMEL